MKKLVLVCLLLLGPACCVTAADLEKDHYIESQTKFLQSERIFPDWKGIAFLCDIKESNPLQKTICQNFTQDLEKLCAAQNIPLQVFEPTKSGVFLLTFKVHKDNLMPLELVLKTNDVNQNETTGIYAELRSALWFSDAVSAEDVLLEKKSRPRAGDLVMYSDYLIGSGLADKLAAKINQGLKTILTRYLMDFKNNNKAHLKPKMKGD